MERIFIEQETSEGLVLHEFVLGSEVLFPELRDECDKSVQYFCSGDEKKEVADRKIKAFSTISNQVQKAIEDTGVRNGRELAFKMAFKIIEKLLGVKVTFDVCPVVRASIACCLLCVFSLSLYHEQGDMRRSRRSRVEQIERIRRLET
jgi:hypothetical protein|nr:MAG TPA: hypothetical protein [Caudoviricetes sp.]